MMRRHMGFDGSARRHPEPYIDSPRINDYPVIHVYELQCENCSVGQQEDGGGIVTEEIARARMKQQTEDLFESGCDLPKIEMSVEFINLGDTEEYKQFRNLEKLLFIRLCDRTTPDDGRRRYGADHGDRMGLFARPHGEHGDRFGWEDAGEHWYHELADPERIQWIEDRRRVYFWRSFAIRHHICSSHAGRQHQHGSFAGRVCHRRQNSSGGDRSEPYFRRGHWTRCWPTSIQRLLRGQRSIGRTLKAFSAQIAEISKAHLVDADINWANIDNLAAAVANIAKAHLTDADIQWADIENLECGHGGYYPPDR